MKLFAKNNFLDSPGPSSSNYPVSKFQPVYSTSPSSILAQPDSVLGTSLPHCQLVQPGSSVDTAKVRNAEIIEISSDSDSDESLLSSSIENTTSYLIQQYSNNFSCSTHISKLKSTSYAPSAWPLSRISQMFNQNLPTDYPESGRFGYNGKISKEQWLSLLCGLCSESTVPPVLQKPTADCGSPTTTTYDIDSLIAKVKCLSVATKGLRVQFSPSCLRNISSDIHLFSKIEERQLSGKVHIHQVPLHQIPHFYLGHLASSCYLPLYVFLPGLWNKNVNNSYISNQHLQQWMDIGFIPAIHQHCPADVIQHFPACFSLACMNIFARGRELGIQDGRFESGKRQELHYFLSAKYLASIWQSMIKFSQRPGYTHFQEMFLLVDAKDLKLQLKSSSMAGSWELLTSMLEGEVDFSCLDENFQFLDLGQEISCQDKSASCFFRTCCLENSLGKIKGRSTGLKATTYSWALTTATANQTLAYSKCSSQYQTGLIYSQYYSPLKSLFDAGGSYPFQNSSLDYLSLHSEIVKIWQSSGSGGERFQVDMEKLEKSYTYSRDRVLLALRAAIQQRRSFGIRQEHRLSFQLFQTLKGREDEITISQLPSCSYLQNSEEIFHFVYGNFLRFGLALEYTASKLRAASFEQSQDLSRIFRMFLQLQKASFTNTLLQAQGDLWRSEREIGANMLYGLGLKEKLETYNFCWLSPSVMEWNRWIFGKILSQSTIFNYVQIHPAALYKAKDMLYQKSHWEILEQFGELLREIQDCSSQKTYKILAFLGTMVIQKFRTDVWTALFKFCDCEWKEDTEMKRELAVKGQLPLDYENVVGYAPSRFGRIKYSNKHKLSLQDRWEILFHSSDKWDQQEVRKAWKDKSYRLYFQKCYSMISDTCDLETAKCWEYLLVQTQFARANFLLPSPAKHCFLQKQTVSGQASKIYWVAIQHESWVMCSELRKLPEKGSMEDKWDKWRIDYYSPIPDQYESPDRLYMGSFEAFKVLERFQKKKSIKA